MAKLYSGDAQFHAGEVLQYSINKGCRKVYAVQRIRVTLNGNTRKYIRFYLGLEQDDISDITYYLAAWLNLRRSKTGELITSSSPEEVVYHACMYLPSATQHLSVIRL